MATIPIRSDKTGRTYNITIAGDQPTAEEQARATAAIQQRDADFATQYEEQFGRPLGYDDGTAFDRGIDKGKTSGYSALGVAAETAGQVTGFDGLAGLGARMQGQARAEQIRENVNLPQNTSFSDAEGVGEFFTALGEVGGQTAPEMTATIGSMLVGTAAGGPVGGLAAGAATALPLFFGRNVELQRSEVASGRKEEVDLWDAFLSAGGQAALNVIGDKLLVGRLASSSGGIFSRASKGFVQGAATEIPTEIGQQVLERLQAGLPLDDDNAIAQYKEVAIGAGLIGGTVGGVTGPFKRTGDAPATAPPAVEEVDSVTVENPDLATITDEDMAAVEGEFIGPQESGLSTALNTKGSEDLLTSLGIPSQLTVSKKIKKLDLDDPTVLSTLAAWSETPFANKKNPKAVAATKKYITDKTATDAVDAADVNTADVDAVEVTDVDAVDEAPVDDVEVAEEVAPVEVAEEVAPVEVTEAANEEAANNATRPNEQATGEGATSSELDTKESENVSTKEGAAPAESLNTGGVGSGVLDTGGVTRTAKPTADTVDGPTAAPNPSVLNRNAAPGAESGAAGQTIPPSMSGLGPQERALVAEQNKLRARLASAKDAGAAAKEQGITLSALQSADRLRVNKIKFTDLPNATKARKKKALDDAALSSAPTQASENYKAARQDAADTFAANASPQLKSEERLYAGDYGDTTDVLTASDYKAVKSLLATPNNQLKNAKGDTAATKKNKEAAKSAKNFFSKNSDPMKTLVQIGYSIDANESDTIRSGGDQDAVPEYFQGTGRIAGMRAAQWVADNMNNASTEYVLGVAEEMSTEAAITANDTYRQSVSNVADRTALEAEREALRTLLAGEEIDNLTFDDRMKLLDKKAKAMRTVLGISPSSKQMFALSSDAGPSLVSALRAGDMVAALEAIQFTSPSRTLKVLARNLIPYMDGVTVGVYNRTGRIVNPDGSRNPLIAKLNDGRFVEVDATYDPDTHSIALADNGIGLNVKNILHEALHAATVQELNNSNSPFTRKIKVLMDRMNAQYPANSVGEADSLLRSDYNYGMSNVYEFVTNGLTNDNFLNALDRVPYVETVVNVDGTTDKSVMTLRDRFVKLFRDFVAKILRRKTEAVTPDDRSIADELSELTNALLTTPGALVNTSPLYGAATNPIGAMGALNGLSARVVDATEANVKDAFDSFSFLNTSSAVKEFVANAAIPMRNMVDYAKPFFGDLATQVYNIVTQHNAAIKRMNDTNRETIDQVAKYLKDFPADVGTFNDMAFQASQRSIDPRKPRSHYENHTLRYWTMHPDGRPKEPVVEVFTGDPLTASKRRNARLRQLNADPIPNSRGRAAIQNTPDNSDTFATYLELRGLLDQLNANSNGEAGRSYGRMLGMYKNMHSEAARVFKARIGAMLPGNESLQRAIYRDIFDKMFTMNMLEAYLPLQRIGDFWLSYTATDPTSKELEVFSETFETPEQRARTVKELTELQTADPTTGIASIATFSNYKDFQERGAPTAFVAKTVLKIDQSVKERAEKAGADAKQEALAAGIIEADADVLAENAQSAYTTEATADATKLKEDLVNIALEMMPERSFLQSYKARKGTSGFEGGRTPLNKKLERHDAVNLMMRKSTMMSRQLADLEFGAKSSDLIRRLNEVAQKKSPNYSDKDNANMRISLNVLKKGLGNINVKRSKLVQSLNTFTYMMTLGFNVSSAVMNVMGIPTIIAPYLAGKYGANSTARALSRATKVIANSGRTRMVSRVDEFGNIEQYERGVSKADASLENYNFDAYDYTAGYNSGSNKTARYGPLTSVMRDRGLFADSLHYDNLDVQGMKTGGLAQSFVMKGAYLMHQTEKLVRESTAIATYDLELDKISKGNDAHVFTKEQLEAAALNAAYETEVTNGTIAAAAAPNFAQNGIMPMMYMFKRYPLAIYNLLGTLANESFPGHKKLLAEFGSVDSEGYIEGMQGRKVARLQLAAIVGNVGLWAGVAGLPLYGALTGVLDYVFKDEDELDSDTLFRIAIGEGASRGLANYLFGVEASSRIGLANMFYRDPFRSEDNPPVWNFIEGAGGPVVGLTNAILTRVPDLFEKGQTGRALEALAPASMRNVMKSFRFSSAGGAESMRGDMIAEIGMGQVLGQLLGFSPAGYIRQTQLSSALKSMDIAIAEQRTQALKRLNLANREGNIIAAKRAMETIDEFNKKNPDNPIKRSTIKSSAANFKKTTLRTYNGVQYNPATEKRMVQWIAYFEGRGDAPT